MSYLHMPNVPIIERFTDLRQVRFDDYIVVFPPQSGLAPLYVMFRDRREL
ncbi:S-type pyocin domain-containing protein [Pseudomonas sp. NPDC089407]